MSRVTLASAGLSCIISHQPVLYPKTENISDLLDLILLILVQRVVRACDVVIGCIDPVVPRGANMTRTGDKAVITCRSTAQTWHIVCQGSVWYGKVDNCTTSKQPLNFFYLLCNVSLLLNSD